MNTVASRFRDSSMVRVLIIGSILLFSGYRIAKLIVFPSPYVWLLVAVIPIVFVIMKSYEFGIYLIMFSVFFADWLYGLGFIPAQLTWFPEVVLLLYIVKFLFEKRRLAKTPIDLPIMLFILIAISSTLINSISPVSTFLALRLDLKFVLMFYVLVSLNLEGKIFRRFMKVLIFLLVIQVPVAFYKYTIYGQNEAAVGTYTNFGGAVSTILPLFTISLFAGLYLYHRKLNTYLLFILGYLFFPILSDKRGFVFFGIVLFVFLIWETKGAVRRRLLPIMLVLLPGLFASLLLVTEWRNSINNPRGIYDYAISYTYQRNAEGVAGGRMSAIQESFDFLSTDMPRLIFGNGPGSTIKSFFTAFSRKGQSIPVPIEYGFTHLVSTAIDYGYVGFLAYFIFPLSLLFKFNQKFFKECENHYWRAVSFGFAGMIFSSFLIGLFYWELFRLDVPSFVFWFFSAAVYSMSRRREMYESESAETDLST